MKRSSGRSIQIPRRRSGKTPVKRPRPKTAALAKPSAQGLAVQAEPSQMGQAPPKEALAYIEGKSPVSRVPTPLDEGGDVFGMIADPPIQGLAHGGEVGVRTSRRMLAELAGHSFSNWGMLTNKLRTLQAQSEGTTQKEREHYAKLADRAFHQTVTALELLQRPEPGSVKVTIAEASNVNFGQQSVDPGSVATQKPDHSEPSNDFESRGKPPRR